MIFERYADSGVGTVSRHDVRAYRRSLSLDQISFSKMLGVNQATISRWESGRTPIDQNKCRRIFENFDLPGSVAKPIEPFDKVELDSHWPSLIKFYRQSRCISQMDMAELLDVDITTVYRWENGRTTPGLKEQIRLRDLLLRPLSLNSDLLNIKRRIANSRQSISLAFGYIWVAFSESARRRYQTVGYDIKVNPSLSPHESYRSDESRVIHTDWTQERLRAGFWRGEVPISRCSFYVDETSNLNVVAFPVVFEDGTTLTILQSRIVKEDFPRAPTGRSFSLTHADEIVG